MDIAERLEPLIPRSLRARIALVIFIPIAMLALYVGYQEYDEYRAERAQARENVLRVSSLAAAARRERFDAAQRLLLAASQLEAVRAAARNADSDANRLRCAESLGVVSDLLPETFGFGVWDTEGGAICGSAAVVRDSANVQNRQWFQQTRERGDFAIGEFQATPDDAPGVLFGLPLRDSDEEIIAYLSMGITLSRADESIAAADIPDDANLAIVDEDGTVITATDRAPGEQFDGLDLGTRAIAGYPASALESDGDTWHAVSRVTDNDDTGVFAVLSAPSASLVQPFEERIFSDLLVLPLVAMATAVVLWYLAELWFMRPVRRLGRGQQALAAGDLSHRVAVTHDESELDQLGSGFNAMAESLEDATRAKDEFLGLVSHELKTPITTVLGNAEILSRRGDRLSEESRREALIDIHESAQRLDTIIENLLVLARLDRGVGLETEPLALRRMVEDIAAEHRQRYGTHRVNVHGAVGVLAMGGEAYVDQVIRNLLSNAEKYSPPDQPIDVYVTDDGTVACVVVADRGSGIDTDELEAIFTPFYRSARTSSNAEGMGIGLAVCRRLIEALSGEIWAKARAGGGCEFGFSLPRVALPAEEGPPEAGHPVELEGATKPADR